MDICSQKKQEVSNHIIVLTSLVWMAIRDYPSHVDTFSYVLGLSHRNGTVDVNLGDKVGSLCLII